MSDARLDALEARLQALEDEREIRELLSTYGFTADLGREQDYADLWTEDGVYDLDEGAVTGRAALYDLVKSPEGLHKRVIENRSAHVPVNLYIRVDGVQAWAEAYSLVVVLKDGAYQLLTCGYNHWDFEKVDGRWHVKRRLRRAIGGKTWGGDVIKAFLAG